MDDDADAEEARTRERVAVGAVRAEVVRVGAPVQVPAARSGWDEEDDSEEAGAPVTTRFSFALDRPGPPVLLEQELDGQVVFRMVLVEDSRDD